MICYLEHYEQTHDVGGCVNRTIFGCVCNYELHSLRFRLSVAVVIFVDLVSYICSH